MQVNHNIPQFLLDLTVVHSLYGGGSVCRNNKMMKMMIVVNKNKVICTWWNIKYQLNQLNLCVFIEQLRKKSNCREPVLISSLTVAEERKDDNPRESPCVRMASVIGLGSLKP